MSEVINNYFKLYYQKNREQLRKKAGESIKCDVCDKEFSRSHKANHYKSKCHIINMLQKNYPMHDIRLALIHHRFSKKNPVEIDSSFEVCKIHENYLISPIKGLIIHKQNRIPLGNFNKGYITLIINKKTYLAHRIIWEHVYGKIQDDKCVDHINNDKTDNRIENLQLVTVKENNLKSAKNRDYSFVKNNKKNRKTVKAISDNETLICQSLYNAYKKTGVNAGLIKMCCEGKNYVKGGTGNNDVHWRFEYTNEPFEKDIQVRKSSYNKYLELKEYFEKEEILQMDPQFKLLQESQSVATVPAT